MDSKGGLIVVELKKKSMCSEMFCFTSVSFCYCFSNSRSLGPVFQGQQDGPAFH